MKCLERTDYSHVKTNLLNSSIKRGIALKI